MGKVLKFPVGGIKALEASAQNAARVAVLEARMIELEQRSSVMREDIEYIGECLMTDTEELSNILGELAELNGFDSSKSMGSLDITTEEMPIDIKFTPDPELAKTLTRWLDKDKEGDDHEDW